MNWLNLNETAETFNSKNSYDLPQNRVFILYFIRGQYKLDKLFKK